MNVRRLSLKELAAGLAVASSLLSANMQTVSSLPPPEDTPDEVLRTEIITEARSPVDGKPLTASEYAQQQSQLQASSAAPPLSPKLRNNIFLLRIRKLFRTFAPFLPI